MALQMARPYKHPKTGIYYYRQKIPADLRPKLGDKIISRSLHTRDPQTAKTRNAEEVRKQALLWDRYRKEPEPLTQKQIVALSGTLYRDIMAIRGDNPWEPESWEAALAFSEGLDTREKKERWYGPSVDSLLLETGIVTNGESRWRVVQEFDRAFRQAIEQLLKRSHGDYSEDPKGHRFPKLDIKAPAPSLTIRGLFKLWEQDHIADGKSARTVGDFRQKVESLCEFLGHDDPARITAENISDWCDHLRQEKGLAGKTVAVKYLAAVKLIFKVAAEKHKIRDNPAEGVTYRFNKKKRRDRSQGYTETEARTILAAARSLRGIDNWAAHTRNAVRWGPWICAFTGARITEVMQLRKEDLYWEGNIPCVRITPEAGSVKSGHFRVVPLHPQLVSEGLVDFINGQASGPLFHGNGTKSSSRRTAEYIGQRVGQWVREIVGITDRRLQPNHAWRHRFKTLARDHDMDPEYRDAIQGHEDGRASTDYGETTVKAMYREIKRLPELSLSQELASK